MRKLNLKKETLTELVTAELAGVVGGTMPTKFDCTESHQVCNPLSVEACVASLRQCITTIGQPCIPTQGC